MKTMKIVSAMALMGISLVAWSTPILRAPASAASQVESGIVSQQSNKDSKKDGSSHNQDISDSGNGLIVIAPNENGSSTDVWSLEVDVYTNAEQWTKSVFVSGGTSPAEDQSNLRIPMSTRNPCTQNGSRCNDRHGGDTVGNVPEPSSFALLVAGLLGSTFVGSRRKVVK